MLTELNYPLDLKKLKKDADDLNGYRQVKGCIGDAYGMLKKTECSTYTKSVATEFQALINSVRVRPRFYLQAPGYVLKMHIDRITKCSLCVLLSEDPAPITFENETVHYHVALINNSVIHGVTNTSHHMRVLLKLSVMDKSYSDVRAILEQNNLIKTDAD
jgi:hypothetical protein